MYEKKPRKLILSRFTGDGWMPCPSGYTRGQGWGLLHKAWIGYKRANNPKNRVIPGQVKMGDSDAQTDLRLRRTSFPNLGLLGDYIFLYDQEKELELQTEEDELWLKEYKKKMRAHIQEIIYSSMISEQEREWMKEYASQSMTDQTYDNEDRYLERIIMPNLFEMRRNNHN